MATYFLEFDQYSKFEFVNNLQTWNICGASQAIPQTGFCLITKSKYKVGKSLKIKVKVTQKFTTIV